MLAITQRLWHVKYLDGTISFWNHIILPTVMIEVMRPHPGCLMWTYLGVVCLCEVVCRTPSTHYYTQTKFTIMDSILMHSISIIQSYRQYYIEPICYIFTYLICTKVCVLDIVLWPSCLSILSFLRVPKPTSNFVKMMPSGKPRTAKKLPQAPLYCHHMNYQLNILLWLWWCTILCTMYILWTTTYYI